MAIEHINEFDTLNAGREKINKHAIDPANRAELNSIDAKSVANQANQTSQSAEAIAVNTDDRLDNIIAGEMQDAEVIDARRPFGSEAYATLGERLDKSDAQLAQTATQNLLQETLFEQGSVDLGNYGLAPATHRVRILKHKIEPNTEYTLSYNNLYYKMDWSFAKDGVFAYRENVSWAGGSTTFVTRADINEIYIVVGKIGDRKLNYLDVSDIEIKLERNSRKTVWTANTTDLQKRGAHYYPVKIEKSGTEHLPTFEYTAFFTGAMVKGKEVHVGRTGNGHIGNGAVLVAYIKKEDGSFDRKKINGIDYSIGDFRDANLTYHPVYDLILLTVSVKKIDGNYTNYIYKLTDSFDIKETNEINNMQNWFCWGNTLITPSGKTLKSAYNISDHGYIGGVGLFRSGDTAPTAYDYTKVLDLFPQTAEKPTECTLGYWGDRLIAITRQDAGNMLYRETYDLSGLTGWGEIKNLGFVGNAPVLLPYTKKGEPLILGYCALPGNNRSPYFRVTLDGFNYTLPLLVNSLGTMGGYQSLVPNENGYGFMYYQDGYFANTTDVIYQEMDIISKLKRDIEHLELNKNIVYNLKKSFNNGNIIHGDCTDINTMFSTESKRAEMEFEVKKDCNLAGIELLLSHASSANPAIEIKQDGVLIGTSDAVAVGGNTKTIYKFNFSTPISLIRGKKYKIKTTVNTIINAKNTDYTWSKVDFGDFCYLKTYMDGVSVGFEKYVIPFGLIVN